MPENNTSSSTQRLNKYLAHHFGFSRREADEMIARGEVKINDQVAPIGARLNDDSRVTVNDKAVKELSGFTYIAFNKPRGYVCSRKQQGDRPTIYSLLPIEYKNLKPVGRLDADSSGLILLTDDGDFTFTMTHPKFVKQKTYLVMLDTDLQPLHHQMINDYGIQLDDGTSKLSLERLHEGNSKSWTVRMSEGRNRQIRRTFSALGYTVVKLHRTEFGSFQLGNLARGETQVLSINPSA